MQRSAKETQLFVGISSVSTNLFLAFLKYSFIFVITDIKTCWACSLGDDMQLLFVWNCFYFDNNCNQFKRDILIKWIFKSCWPIAGMWMWKHLNFLWKQKHFEERSLKQKQTHKCLTFWGAGSIFRKIWGRDVEAEAVKFLWKRKHSEERSWKQKQTRKWLT